MPKKRHPSLPVSSLVDVAARITAPCIMAARGLCIPWLVCIFLARFTVLARNHGHVCFASCVAAAPSWPLQHQRLWRALRLWLGGRGQAGATGTGTGAMSLSLRQGEHPGLLLLWLREGDLWIFVRARADFSPYARVLDRVWVRKEMRRC